MTQDRLAQIAALLSRIDQRNLMSTGEAWQLRTACRDLLEHVARGEPVRIEAWQARLFEDVA